MSRKDEKGVVSEETSLPAEAPANQQGTAQEAAAAAKETGGESKGGAAEGGGDRTAALEREIADLKDQLLRRAADYENFRKRMFREREDAVRYANQMLLLDLVPVIDDFERAILSAESSRDFDKLHDGIVLIERQLSSMLEKKWELARFESTGQAFDPERHHAIATEDRPDVEAATVVEEYQSGYLFRDRVLRPARVRVAQPAPRETKEQNSTQSKET
jgi:molecular chaperone GrpE